MSVLLSGKRSMRNAGGKMRKILVILLILSSSLYAENFDKTKIVDEIKEWMTFYREEEGVKPIVYNEQLGKLAVIYAQKCYENGKIDHHIITNERLAYYIDSLGLPRGYYIELLGEVPIYYKSYETFYSFVNSPEHNAGLLNQNATDFGVGIVRHNKDSYFIVIYLFYKE